MEIKHGDDTITFSTGRTIYANCGIIGLSPDLHIYEGFDGRIEHELTPKERQELADYMIMQWQKVRDSVVQV